MSVLDIVGFEDFPTLGDSLLCETMLKGWVRASPLTQSLSVVARNGRQWLRCSGTSTGASGYSTNRNTSLWRNLYSAEMRPALLTKKFWFGYRYRTVLTSASQIPTSASMYFGANFNLPVALISPAEVTDNTEYFFEFGVDWANKTIEVWRDGVLIKTLPIPLWADVSFTGYTFVVGYIDQDYAGSASVAFARVFDINDIYMLVDDGIGLSKRLGPLKIKAMVINDVQTGEGWTNPTGTDPVSLLTLSSVTPGNKLNTVLRSSTKHTPLTIGFAKPSSDDRVEYLSVDVVGFRDDGTATKLRSTIKVEGTDSTAAIGTLSFGALTVTNTYAGEKTPGNAAWSPDNVDTLTLSINSVTGG